MLARTCQVALLHRKDKSLIFLDLCKFMNLLQKGSKRSLRSMIKANPDFLLPEVIEMVRNWFDVLSAGVFLFGLAGCQGNLPALYSVEVELVQDGKPVDRGALMFEPEKPGKKSIVFNAEHTGGGKFRGRVLFQGEQGTQIKPGVAAGTYRVLYHPPSDGQRTNLEVPLKETLTVQAGENKVCMELPKVEILPQIVEPPGGDEGNP